MNKFSKVIALTLSATMIFGSSLTVFADDPVTSSTGAGKPEGHVDKKVTNVVLPTTVADTTFAYTMDPEKLIEVTSHGKYGDDVVFPSANDTYVYFNNGTNDDNKTVYANTSAAVTITNKSSHDINLKVSAAATASQEGKDIPLVAKDAYASASDPSLYLGLIVGSKAAVAIAEETPADQTVTIPGTEGNFKIAVKNDKSGYEYRVLNLDEWTALDGNSGKTEDDFNKSWKNTTISLEGGVTTGKSITSETTAPSVEVTWSWTDPTEGPQLSMTTSGLITVSGLTSSVNLVGGEELFIVDGNGGRFNLNDDPQGVWGLDGWSQTEGGTVTRQIGSAWMEGPTVKGQTVKIIANFTDGTSKEITVDIPAE